MRVNNIPDKILEEFTVVKIFDTGGSSANTLLVREKKNNNQCILKYATWGGIGSSGLPWLRAQSRRFQELGKIKDQKIKNSLPIIFGEYEEQSLFFYTMEYFPDSYPISSYCYQKKLNAAEILNKVDVIIDLLTRLYDIKTITSPRDFICEAHIKRILNRTNLLTDKNSIVYYKALKNKPVIFPESRFDDLTDLFIEIKKHDFLYINGRKIKNLSALLPEINNETIFNLLQPNFLPKYYHGDSTLRNYLLSKTGVKIIDIRGTDLPNSVVSKIDIAYELGKIVRTFYLEIIRANDFKLDLVKRSAEFYFDFSFGKSRSVSNFIDARNDFLDSVHKYQKRYRILEMEKHLLLKILYAEAAHFIADAVNRIESDSSGKQTIAYYLLGLQLFDQVLEKIKRHEK